MRPRVRAPWPFAVVLLGACAPASTYVPPPMLVPFLEGADDLAVSAHFGTGGFQLGGAYAVTDVFAVRALAHADTHGDAYVRMGAVGISVFNADRESGLLVSGSLDLGYGAVHGAQTVDTGGTEYKRYYWGDGYRGALQIDLGFESKYFAAAAVLRSTLFRMEHDSRSFARNTRADAVYLEPGALVRAGFEDLKLEAQGGVSAPVHRSGVIGSHRPWILALGLTMDFE